jgi:peptidoglycan DL-endopeptidase CwlO
MLAGIVAMQVEVLKLGASMGRSLEQNSVLSSRNAALRQSVATLGDDQRIEQLAATMGMVMPPPQSVGFLAASPGGNAGRALANIHQPSVSSFGALTSTNGEIVTATTLAAANAPTGTTGSTSTIGSTPTSTSSTSSATSSSAAATSPVAAAPTVPSTAAGSTAATPTPVTQAPTTSSGATSSGQTTSASTGPSTGAAGVGPPSTTVGG